MIKVKDMKDKTFVTVTIQKVFIKNARLRIEQNSVYICQNFKNGTTCYEKYGYKYSWYLGSLDELNSYEDNNRIEFFLSMTQVKNLNLFYKKWDDDEN